MRRKNGKLYSNIKCNICGKYGHHADDDPSDNDEEHGGKNFQFSMKMHQLLENKKFSIDDLLKLVIIDAGSVSHLF